MAFPEILLIAIGLAMDAFAVSLGVGSSRTAVGPRPAFRLSFHFGLFQFMMPVIGWTAGYTVQPLIAAFDHWIAFGLLLLVGGRMIRSGVAGDGDVPENRRDPTTGWSLVMLSVATSIDALAIGLSLAMLRIDIWYPSTIIGIVTAALSLLGLRLGNMLGKKFGRSMEIAGGAILFSIGIRILIQHLSA